MRRPLFGNGIPRNILNADGAVTILDTEDLDEGSVYALTLYLWIYQPGPGPFTNPNFVLATSINGGGPQPLANYAPTRLDLLFNSPNGPWPIEPIKVLDRYMMRGKQTVVAVNGDPAAQSCFVWGYFEQIGVQDVGIPFRGLQPDLQLTDPFAYDPVVLNAVAPGSAQAVVHTLDPNYVDLVTLDVALSGASDTSGVGFGGAIAFPGSVGIALPSIDFPTLGLGLVRIRVLDGIPMRALDNTAAGSQILLGCSAAPPNADAVQAMAYGSFVRT